MITFIESLKDGTSTPGPAKLNAWVYNSAPFSSVFFYFFYIYMFTCVSKYISTNEYLCIYIGFEKLPRVVNIRPQKKNNRNFPFVHEQCQR